MGIGMSYGERWTAPETMLDILRQQVERHGDKVAFAYSLDGESEQGRLTYGQLDVRARAIAASLQRQGAAGEPAAENARATAELWAGFSRTAADNPDAWRREPVAPEFLEHPSAKNPMLAAPYTKWHTSQWNVDQAAGFILCSTEAADRAGVPQDRRVYLRWSPAWVWSWVQPWRAPWQVWVAWLFWAACGASPPWLVYQAPPPHRTRRLRTSGPRRSPLRREGLPAGTGSPTSP